MRKFSVIACLLMIFLFLKGQTPVGSWSDHLIYSSAKNIAVGNGEVFASTGSSIIIYNKVFAELRKLSAVNNLSETGISAIAWSKQNEALIIAYNSTNVDIVTDNTVFNVPDISRKYIPGKKEIYRIRTNGKYAYLACSFGIVVLDIVKKEIYDTWKPCSAEVWDIAIANNRVYAATGQGLYSAELSNPGLSFFGNWNLLNNLPVPQGNYTSVIFSGNRLYVNKSDPVSGDSIFVIAEDCSLFSYLPGVRNIAFDLDTEDEGFTVTSQGSVRYFKRDGSLKITISSYGWGTPNISQAVADNGNIWIADINEGLITGNDMKTFSRLTLPGPMSNDIFYLTSGNGKLLVCGGGINISWTNLNKPLLVSVFENNRWTSISSGTIFDPMRAITDPENNNHLFVSTWGGGLLEYENNLLIHQYSYQNSPLQTIIPGQPYVRICGLTFEKQGKLWMTQNGVPGSLKILKTDGTTWSDGSIWLTNPVTINAASIGDITITRNGHKWITLPRGPGLFILDDNNTPENFSDDRSKIMVIKDSENKVIPFASSIAEDLDGNIWVGTDQGPVVYFNPERVFDEDLKAVRIKTPRNDGSGLYDFVLVNESITSISVDGGNRKWIGTSNSGAFLLSPDGTKLIKNFNEQNSPILSNSIVSLSIDNKSGEVWFGTSKGIVSYRSDATEGEIKFSKVYTFPNPVREDCTGNVTITGLIRDSQIRITDISGNLVYETESKGGEASWDLKTYNGKRVSTGVYLVFCASNDGKQAVVTKMLVIK
jgi:ligand-binding sensor domain-containing protein